MKKTLMTFGLTLTVLATAVAFPAFAAEEINLDGTGVLIAGGDGEATIEGNIIYFSVRGEGEVKITDLAGDAVVHAFGFGERKISENEWKYEGRGKVVAKGSNIVIEVEGKHLHLIAAGTGSAHLEGEGSYAIRHIILPLPILPLPIIESLTAN
ncbi:MAG: hypothetical protein AAB464_02090 [Patescibacteria group bacterium]